MDRIKVLIVDDSALVRKLLKDILDLRPRHIDVVGTATDSLIALRKFKDLKPYVPT
jgi:two-component system chemotaxis response regulator CheB